MPELEPVELINVAFATDTGIAAQDAPDRYEVVQVDLQTILRVTGLRSYQDLKARSKRPWIFIKAYPKIFKL